MGWLWESSSIILSEDIVYSLWKIKVCYVARSFEMWFYVLKLFTDLMFGLVWKGYNILLFTLGGEKNEWFYQSFLYQSFVIFFGKLKYFFYKERLIGFYELWMFKKLFMRKRRFIHDLHVPLLLLPLDLNQEGFIYDLHVILLLVLLD